MNRRKEMQWPPPKKGPGVGDTGPINKKVQKTTTTGFSIPTPAAQRKIKGNRRPPAELPHQRMSPNSAHGWQQQPSAGSKGGGDEPARAPPRAQEAGKTYAKFAAANRALEVDLLRYDVDAAGIALAAQDGNPYARVLHLLISEWLKRNRAAADDDDDQCLCCGFTSSPAAPCRQFSTSPCRRSIPTRRWRSLARSATPARCGAMMNSRPPGWRC